MSTDNLITIENLTFCRGERKIFDAIDMVIPRGKITAVMGPSGTGKTTLLRLIGGQLKPDIGAVFFKIKIFTNSPEKLYTNFAKKWDFYFKAARCLPI